MFGYGYWAVERREDGRFIGQIGFADFKRDMTPSIEGLPEMGWLFAADAFGQGYASEAVGAGLDWIDRALAPAEVVAIIDEANVASIRVAEKAGFARRETGDLSRRADPDLPPLASGGAAPRHCSAVRQTPRRGRAPASRRRNRATQPADQPLALFVGLGRVVA